jgi:hypothetical protein
MLEGGEKGKKVRGSFIHFIGTCMLPASLVENVT